MDDNIGVFTKKASPEELKKYRQYLQRPDKKKLLNVLPVLHEEAFRRVDCLTCANCCKNYSPRFKTPDIKRIAKYVKLKEGAFIEKFLLLDTEGDYVVNAKPCPFLDSDNRCKIYEVRPSDCQRFPYTDEDVFFKRQNITMKNATFCPIVVFVMDKLVKSEK